MKRIMTILAAVLLTTLTAAAQTLNVTVGSVTYQFPAAQAGEMSYNDGKTLTIMGRTFTISDITSVTIDNAKVTDNQVAVSYSGTSAKVTVAGNVAQYVVPTVSGAHVTIAQSNTAAVDDDEITYQLSGTTTDGEFALSGSYKCTVSLAGLTLTNPSGAAINITNKKRIQISAKKGTENTLTDGAGGSQKGCLYSKGQIQLQGNGALTVYGNTAHAIKSGDYISVKNLTLNVKSAVKDGISCNKYFLMKSGVVSISGTGDDGVQCDLESDDDKTGETTDHEDENSGNVYLEGGSITIDCAATAAKGIKAAGDLNVSGGTIDVTTTGKGEWDSDDSETKAACGLSCDGNMNIAGGTLTLTAKGAGGKGMKCDGVLTITDGTITVVTSGGLYYHNGTTENTNYTGDTERISSAYYSSPKGIKAGVKTESTVSGRTTYTYSGGIDISGGTISVTTSGRNAEGIESKNYLNITGGHVTVNAYDDAINAAQDLTVEGGYVYARASNNDGLDANGNCYIKGGLVYAIGSTSPEVAIDANSEEQKKLYVTGGTIVAIGGLESGCSLSQSCYSSSSWSKNTWYALYNGGELALAFKTPASGGNTLVVSTAGTTTLKSGVTVSGGTEYFGGVGNIGGTISGGSNVSLSSYSSGSSGPGGGFQPGQGGGGWRW